MIHDFLMWAGGIILTAVFSLIGWVMKSLQTRIDKSADSFQALETRFDAHRLYASETFATKNELNKGFDRIMMKLDKIDDKLDTKLDK